MYTKTCSYKSNDRKSHISAQYFLPESPPSAILQVIHGVSEHIGRYGALANNLTAGGIAVAGNDHLGHGGSMADGKKGYFSEKDGWTHVCRDALSFTGKLIDEYPGTPLFILGHSMGSFITRTLMINGLPDNVRGIILTGTGHQSPLITIPGKMFAGLEYNRSGKNGWSSSKRIEKLAFGAYNKRFSPNRTTHDWISSDNSEVDIYLNDELCGFPPSTGLFIDMLDGLDFIRKQKNINGINKNTPILMMSGEEDPVGNMGRGVQKVYRSYKKAGVMDIQLVLFPGSRHEIFHDKSKYEATNRLYEWINSNI